MSILLKIETVVDVTNPNELIRAARERAVAEGLAADMHEASELIEDDDYGAAARIIFDPGLPMPGVQMLEIECS